MLDKVIHAYLILRILQEDAEKIFLVENNSLWNIQALKTCPTWLVCEETIVSNFSFLEKKKFRTF